MDNRKATEILDKGEKIIAIKETACNMIGAEKTEEAWKEARSILEDLLEKYPSIQPKEQRHTDLIFPHIAVYKALLRKNPDEAMRIMEEGEAVTAIKKAKSYQKIVKLPFGKTLFFKVFAAGCKSGFGRDAGFDNTVYTATGKEYKMDITMCPYMKYCRNEGCPELTHIFCSNDIYSYGHLAGIRFTRTETLGTGGNKCDFWFKKEE